MNKTAAKKLVKTMEKNAYNFMMIERRYDEVLISDGNIIIKMLHMQYEEYFSDILPPIESGQHLVKQIKFEKDYKMGTGMQLFDFAHEYTSADTYPAVDTQLTFTTADGTATHLYRENKTIVAINEQYYKAIEGLSRNLVAHRTDKNNAILFREYNDGDEWDDVVLLAIVLPIRIDVDRIFERLAA